MRVGLLLPTFTETADDALRVADRAAELGVDGLFAYDHLWPMGAPERPDLAPFPVLARVAARTGLVVGPLVARVGLVGTAHLVRQFETLAAVADGRVIAALGTGDRLGEAEMVAYGRGGLGAAGRRALLDEALGALDGFERWVGAGGPATDEIARRHGAALNCWGLGAAEIAARARGGPVTWAGPVEGDLAATLDELADAGATWAVVGNPSRVDEVAEWRAAHKVP